MIVSKLYDCGTKPHTRFPYQEKRVVYKPLLTEVVDLAESDSNQSINYNIEIKSHPEYDGIFTPQVDNFVALVLEVIRAKGIESRAIIQSFDIRALEATKQQKP